MSGEQTSQYDSAIAAVREVLVEHFGSLSSDAEEAGRKTDAVIASLRAHGGTSLAALREARWEDLAEAGIPRLLTRRVAKLFRDGESGEEPESGVGLAQIAAALKSARDRETPELIDAYNPDDPTNPVAQALRERFGDRAFLVFDVSNVFDRAATKELAKSVAQGHPIDEVYVYPGGAEVKIYPVGGRPDLILDLSPVFQRPMPAGTCPDDRCAWGSVPLEVRQLVRLIIEAGIMHMNRGTSLNLFRMATETGFAGLSESFPDAARLFREREALGTLPVLRARVGAENERKHKNPFGVPTGHRQS